MAEPVPAEYSAVPFAEPSTLPDWLTENATEETATIPIAEEPAEPAALPDWLIESTPEEALGAPTAEEETVLPVEAVVLPDWLLESAPEGIPSGIQPEETTIPAAEASALPDWLVEGVPAKLVAADILTKPSDEEEPLPNPSKLLRRRVVQRRRLQSWLQPHWPVQE